jgi:hypothetical protein
MLRDQQALYAAASERNCLCLQVPLVRLLRPREVRRSKEKEFHTLRIPRIPQTSALRKNHTKLRRIFCIIQRHTILAFSVHAEPFNAVVVMNLHACPYAQKSVHAYFLLKCSPVR